MVWLTKFDLRSSLLTLDIVQASLALFSLNRRLVPLRGEPWFLLAGDGGGEGVVEVTDVLVLGGEGGLVPEGHEGVDLGLEFGVGTVEPEEEDKEVTAEDGVGDLGEDGVAATDEVDGTTVVALAVEVGQEGGHQEFCQGVGLAGREALPGGVLGAEGLDNVLAHEVGVVE